MSHKLTKLWKEKQISQQLDLRNPVLDERIHIVRVTSYKIMKPQ